MASPGFLLCGRWVGGVKWLTAIPMSSPARKKGRTPKARTVEPHRLPTIVPGTANRDGTPFFAR
jgi:hypothetical protein